MDNFYFKIDSKSLKKFSSIVQKYLKIEFSKHANAAEKGFKNGSIKKPINHFIRMCPYCDNLYLLSIANLPMSSLKKVEDPRYCVLCGESTPSFKIKLSIEKAYKLYKISTHFLSKHKSDEDKKKQRILIEQSLVILATGIELFFKEMYIIGMDLKYTKNDKTLFIKFSKEAKNEFINIGKINQKYNEDLHLNLKTIFGEQLFKELNILMLNDHLE